MYQQCTFWKEHFETPISMIEMRFKSQTERRSFKNMNVETQNAVEVKQFILGTARRMVK